MDAPDQKAIGIVRLALQRFASRYPLLGALAASWTVLADKTIQTMGVGMRGSSVALYYNPEFVQGISLEQLVGVLHHEARHCVYSHIFLDPADFADQNALTTAEEVTVNENLPEPLPGAPILLKHFPKLPADEDTLNRYRRLANAHVNRSQCQHPSQGRAGCPSANTASGKSSSSVSAASVAPSIGKQTRHGKGSCRSGTGQKTGPLDCHDRWSEIREQPALAKASIAAAIQEALRSIPMPTAYDHVVIDAVSQMCGSEPGAWLSGVLVSDSARQVDWRAVLRRFVGREVARDYSYAVPPRRFPSLLGIVPGIRRSARHPKVLAVIDTSGSMSDDALAQINTELKHLSRECEFVVVECDCEIHATYPYRGVIQAFHGRGGTSFCKPLEHSFLRKIRPDLVVYFTDGCGPAPTKRPRVPVLWVLSSDGDKPAAWGQAARMNLS